ncbi:UNVERIFIED_CONTAM: hypothetical protein FKN15_021447 [Acipenser sinensis]
MTEVTKDACESLPGGGTVEKFQLKSESVTMEIISLGCIITSIKTKDKTGKINDIVLGFDNPEGYLANPRFFGAVVGRVANRIAKGYLANPRFFGAVVGRVANRIAKVIICRTGACAGIFSCVGLVRCLPHASTWLLVELLPVVFQAIWTPEALPSGVRFSLTSADGEEGFPGELKVWVTYILEGEVLTINYRAQTTKSTPINLTNHSYFNLAGHKRIPFCFVQGTTDIYDHEVSIMAEAYLPVDDTMIPTGEVKPVQDSPFDLRKPVQIGQRLKKLPGLGFDHNFCLSTTKEQQKQQQLCARVYHPPSGRVLEVGTSQPGVQFYTANFLDSSLKGKGGAVYPKHSAFCLETQNWPDAVNKVCVTQSEQNKNGKISSVNCS